VAGIVGGDGDLLPGRYVGIAPEAGLVNIKIADDTGAATLADAIAGVEWAVANKDVYNIRVLNMSLHSGVAQSYKRDPLDAAVEFAWFSGIAVVVSSGNMGSVSDAVSYAPANDPFVIVVGATDDMGTAARSDDVVAFFSSRGVTQDGLIKPDVVAPGRKIVSSSAPGSVFTQIYPDRFVDQDYFRLSGTSMASPVVAGVVALMLQQNPALTPGQVKYILTTTGVPLATDPSVKHVLADAATFYAGAVGDTDLAYSPARKHRMVFGAKIGFIAYILGSADPAATAAALGFDPTRAGIAGQTLDTVNWESIKWSAIKWDVIKWGTVDWTAIKWDAIKWDVIKWNAIKWDAIKWGTVDWTAIKWGAIKWDAIKWDAIKWDAVTTTEAELTAVEFASSPFDSSAFDFVVEFQTPTECGHAKAAATKLGLKLKVDCGKQIGQQAVATGNQSSKDGN